MKRGGGSQKGASYERSLCVAFSRWFSFGQTDDLFWRTSGSGSRATRRHKKNQRLTKYQYGDMTYDREEGKPLVEYLNFEFRFRRQLEPLGVFYDTDPNYSLLSFWAKATSEAEQSGRIPILVTKVNRGQSVLWMPSSLFVSLERIGDPKMVFAVTARRVRVEKKVFYTFREPITVGGVLLDTFFERNEPSRVVKAAEQELTSGEIYKSVKAVHGSEADRVQTSF